MILLILPLLPLLLLGSLLLPSPRPEAGILPEDGPAIERSFEAAPAGPSVDSSEIDAAASDELSFDESEEAKRKKERGVQATSKKSNR